MMYDVEDIGSEERTGEYVGRGRNEDIYMDVLCYKYGQN